MTFFLVIAIISYIIPLMTMPTYLNILSNNARIQGGLTSNNIETFKANISNNYGYIQSGNLKDLIEVTASTIPSGIDVSDIDVSDNSLGYVSRKSGEVIFIEVLIPTNNNLFSGVLSFFNDFSMNDYYRFTQVVSSERF